MQNYVSIKYSLHWSCGQNRLSKGVIGKDKSPALAGLLFSFCSNYSWTDITHTPRDSPCLERVFDDQGLDKGSACWWQWMLPLMQRYAATGAMP
jgi:hypothetical protein